MSHSTQPNGSTSSDTPEGPPPAALPVAPGPARNRFAISLPHWMREGLLIAVSAALGFGAAQYGEYRADREHAARALAGIEAEMARNLATLEPFVPVHRGWVQAIENDDRSLTGRNAFDAFISLRPSLPAGTESSFPVLRRSAWDAAVAGDALRLMDYDIVAGLSETYRVQEIAMANVERRLADGALSSASTFDPASREASMKLLQFTLVDILYSERALVDRYQADLPRVRAAAAAAR